jgi:O-antigen/teichoic acid export membrane protein
MNVSMNVNNTTVLLVVTKTVTLILGALITFLAYRAFRRQGAPALRALMVGFGLVTVGSVLGGALYHVAGVGFALGVGIESLVTAVGFGVLVYSLYVSVDEPGDVSSGSRRAASGRDGCRRSAD